MFIRLILSSKNQILAVFRYLNSNNTYILTGHFDHIAPNAPIFNFSLGWVK